MAGWTYSSPMPASSRRPTTARSTSCRKEIWDEIVRVNLTGMYLACKYGVGAIKATAKTGAVVITGSPTGMLGCTPASIAYSSSKAGVHGIARVMAIDYALEGIRVNVVVPGFTLSPIVHELVADPAVWSGTSGTSRCGAAPSPTRSPARWRSSPRTTPRT